MINHIVNVYVINANELLTISENLIYATVVLRIINSTGTII